EFMFAFPSIVIGVSVLSLPSDVAKVTEFSDGWISILIAGILATLLAVSCVKLALNFRKLSFIEYMSTLVTKPIATCIALYYVGISILVSASINRSVASIAQPFLFERTPLAVIALAFLLVVIYAVAGSRIGIFRLNILFLPIILFVFLFVGLLNIPMIESVNFLPLFQTNIKGYAKGLFGSIPAFSGFGLGIFYV